MKKWTGQTTPVFSTISSTEKYTPTLLGSIPFMGETEAAEVIEAANTAYNKGQGLWPTMKVVDRIKCMENFVKQMKEDPRRSGETFNVGNWKKPWRFAKRI